MSAMEKLSTEEQLALRARAHGLSPVVMIGDKGLSDSVFTEIDRSLTAHELVKIRVFNDERAAREAFLHEICARLAAAPVQHIGKILIVYRPKEEPAATRPARSEAGTVRAAAPPLRRRSKSPRAKPIPSPSQGTRRRKI